MPRPNARRRTASGLIFALASSIAFTGAVAASVVTASRVSATATSQLTWQQFQPTTSPSARAGFSLAYDGVGLQDIMFGGSTKSCSLLCTTTYYNDTWAWSGTSWTQLSPASSPSPRANAMMTYDAATNTDILFGGTTANGDVADTWSWNGSTWTQLFPGSSPSARDSGYIAYDAALSQVMLFGGSSNTDTWTWNGSTWTLQGHGGNDPTSSGGAMAYDPATQNVVYQQYSNAEPTYNWSPICCNQPPTSAAWSYQGYVGQPNPTGSAMAYDPLSQTNIMFGGDTSGLFGTTVNNATWSYNGFQWTQLSPLTSPSARYGAGMVTDQETGAIMLFGGTAANGNPLNDTWALVDDPINLVLPWPHGQTHNINGGYTYHRQGCGDDHTGLDNYAIDFHLPSGSQVAAVAAGVAHLGPFGQYNGGYGNYVWIAHPNGFVSFYAHLTSYVVAEGANVSAGQLIAYSGSTGHSSGPHLHFSVRQNATTQFNGAPYLPEPMQGATQAYSGFGNYGYCNGVNKVSPDYTA